MDTISKIVKYITVIFALCAIAWGTLGLFAFMIGFQISSDISFKQDVLPFLQYVVLPLAVGGGLLFFAYTRGDVKKVTPNKDYSFKQNVQK